MKEDRPQIGISIVLSVLAGLVSIVTTFLILIFLFMSIGLFGIGDGESAQITKMARTSTITLIISLLVALGVGFYTIAKMHKPKNQGSRSSPSDTH